MKTSFVIDRSKWRCGGDGEHQRGRGHVSMQNIDGFMCCLGQIRAQCGKPLQDTATPVSCMADGEEPDGLLTEPYHWSAHNGVRHTSFGGQAMIINDDDTLTDIQRERKLERLAEGCGLRIEFTGEYVYP